MVKCYFLLSCNVYMCACIGLELWSPRRVQLWQLNFLSICLVAVKALDDYKLACIKWSLWSLRKLYSLVKQSSPKYTRWHTVPIWFSDLFKTFVIFLIGQYSKRKNFIAKYRAYPLIGQSYAAHFVRMLLNQHWPDVWLLPACSSRCLFSFIST